MRAVFAALLLVSPVFAAPALADVGIQSLTADSTYVPGQASTLTVTVVNTSTAQATGVTLSYATDPAGGTGTPGNWSCTVPGGSGASCPGGSSGAVTDPFDLAADSSLAWELSVDFPASQLDPVDSTITVDAGDGAADIDDTNNAQTVQQTASPRVDLSASFQTPLPDNYIPGTQDNRLTLEIGNGGPSDAVDAQVSIELPEVEAVDLASSTCSGCDAPVVSPATETTPLTLTISGIDAAAGAGPITFDLDLDYDSAARTPSIDIVATVSAGETELDTDNDAATATLEIRREASIGVVKEANTLLVNPQSSFNWTITVTNHGPSDLGGAGIAELVLSDDLPSGLEADNSDAGCGDIPTNLPCFKICPSDAGIPDDSQPASPTNCGVPPLTVVGDLTGQTLALSAGSSTEVRVFAVVGDELVNGDQIVNTARVAVVEDRFERDADGNLVDGNGDPITEPIFFDENGNPVFENGDPVPVQEKEPTLFEDVDDGRPNASTETIDVEQSADLVVTKVVVEGNDVFQSPSVATPGNEITYVVRVLNDSSQAVSQVRVQDDLPLFDETTGTAGLVPTSVTWQCEAFQGACCESGAAQCNASQPSGEDVPFNLDELVDLPGAGYVEFTITGRIDSRSPDGDQQENSGDELVNTARASLPSGIVEANPADDAATHRTELASISALRVNKQLLPIEETPDGAFELTYRINVVNEGPSFAFDVVVTDPLNDPNFADLTQNPATWECNEISGQPDGTACDAATGSGSELNATVDLSPGGEIQFDLTVRTTQGATGTVRNEATATLPSGASFSDVVDASLIGSADLVIEKTSLSTATPGTEHRYTVRVSNKGPDPVFGARVVDEMPLQLENVVWSCEATTPIPGDLTFRTTSGATGAVAGALVVSSDGRHIYQVQPGNGRVQAYVRDNVRGASFGAINPLETETDGVNDGSDQGGQVVNMGTPIDIAISPDQRHVYVLSNPPGTGGADDPLNAVATFAREPNFSQPDYGKLAFNGTQTDGIPADARALAVTRDNLFVVGDGKISVYSLNLSSGLPTLIQTVTQSVPDSPATLAVDRGDDLLFVGSGTNGDVAAFSINDDDSTGTPIGELTHADTVDVGLAGFVDIAAFAESDHLYVAGDGKLLWLDYMSPDQDGDPVFSFDSNKEVAAADVVSFSIAGDGEHVQVARNSASAADNLTYFRRDLGDGTLSSPVDLASNDSALPGLSDPAAVTVSPDGRHVLISSAAGGGNRPLTVYARRAPDPLFELIENDVHLEPISATSTQKIDALASPSDLAVSADGQHVYVVSLDQGAISVFKRTASAGGDEVTAGEHLEFVQSLFNGQAGVEGMDAPRYLELSPDPQSRNVYVTSESGAVAIFRRAGDPNASDYGELSFVDAVRDGDSESDGDTVDGLNGARGMTMDDAGRHLYVAGAFDAAIAVFERDPGDGTLDWTGEVRNGVDFAQGLLGIRALAMSSDDRQLFGVSDQSDRLVVFERETDVADPGFGLLSFSQSISTLVGEQPMAVAASADGIHVYVASKQSDSISTFRRETDPASPAFGTLFPVAQQVNRFGGIEFMDGPRDLVVSPDDKRVYVASEFSSSVIVFDRDLNSSSSNFGTLNPTAVSRDGIDSVDGLDTVYAVAVSPESRNVYAAGFRDQAVASFVLGVGSVCSSGGSGSIDDTVVIGVDGTLEYRISGQIRAGAVGPMINTASVSTPDNVTELDIPQDPQDTDNTDSSTVQTELVPRADLALTKTNNRVSVVAGDPVQYEIEITNSGPSSLVDSISLTDRVASDTDFDPDSVTWTCEAEGSGALSFAEAIIEDPESDVDLALDGIASLTLVPDPDGSGPIPELLAGVSVIDDALVLFSRDPADGSLAFESRVRNGEAIVGGVVDTLAGARSVASSPDGRFIYVASRIDDSLTVFATEFNDAASPADPTDDSIDAVLVTGVTDARLLDQASHVIVDSSGRYVLVAGTNADAIAVYEHDRAGDTLVPVDDEVDGTNDPSDPAATVQGLDGVVHLAFDPAETHLYALSGTDRAVTRFAFDASSGELSWEAADSAATLDVDLLGASSIAMAPDGRHLYISAGAAERLVVLARDADSGSGTFGELTKVEEVVQGEGGVAGLLGPRGVIISRDGLHVYVASQTSNSVTWFLRDDASGQLGFGGVLSEQSTDVSGMQGASALVLDDEKGQVYVAGTLAASVVRFERRADSKCDQTSGTGDLDAIPIQIAAGGTIRFIVNAVVSAEADPGTDPDQPVRVDNVATVNVPDGVDTDPSNNAMTDADLIDVVADLRITKTDNLAEYDGLRGASDVVGDLSNLYTAGAGDDGIGVFERGNDGVLQFLAAAKNGQDGVSLLTDVEALALSPDGAHLYAVSPTDNSLVAFRRDDTDGRLTVIDDAVNGTLGVNGIGGARDVAVSGDGEHVYVAGGFSNAIAVFARDADPASGAYGELTYLASSQNGVSGVAGLTEVTSLAISADGRHVYAVSPVDNSVAVFLRNPNSGSASYGQLSYFDRYVQGTDAGGLAGAIDIAIAGNDTDVYVLGGSVGTLARFERDAETGELAPLGFVADGETGMTTGLTGATALTFSPDQAHLYVASTESDAVVRFSVAADGAIGFEDILRNGDPAPLTGGQVRDLDGVSGLIVSPDGNQLYAVGSLADSLVTLARTTTMDPATNSGALSFADALIDGLGGIAPGSIVTYVITAENAGPSDVSRATVTDLFPDVFSAIEWSCRASAQPQARCNTATNTGSINDTTVELPAGGSVTYTARAVVRNDATGRLVNTATVTGFQVQDPIIANNSATDDDTVLSPSIDLVTTVDDFLSEATPGTSLDYFVEIRNIGASLAAEVIVDDVVPEALTDVTWSCSALPVDGLLAPLESTDVLDRTNDLQVAGSSAFAYAVGVVDGQGAIAAYQRDPVDGELSILTLYREGDATDEQGGSVISGLDSPSVIAPSSDGSKLYVAAPGSDSVLVFARNAESGLLTFLGRYTDGEGAIDGLGGVSDLVLGPRGSYLYAAGRLDDAIAVFSIDGGSGLLSFEGRIVQGESLDSGTVDGLNDVTALAWGEDALFAVAGENQSLAAFEADSATGLLQPLDLIQNFQMVAPSLDMPSDVIVVGDEIVVAAAGGNAISRFTFDAERTPAFERTALVQNDSGDVVGMLAPSSLAYAPRQQRLYVASPGGESVHVFSLRPDQPRLLERYRSDGLAQLGGLLAISMPVENGPIYSLAATGTLGVFARQRGSFCPLGGEDSLGEQAVEITPGGSLDYTVSGTIFANAEGELVYEVAADSRFAERELNPADNRGTHRTRLVPRPDLVVASKTDGRDEVVAGTAVEYSIDFRNDGPSDALEAALIDQPPVHPSNPGLVPGSATWTCDTNAALLTGDALDAASAPSLAGLVRVRPTPDADRLLVANPALDTLLVVNVLPDGSLEVETEVTNGQVRGELDPDLSTAEAEERRTVVGLAGASAAVASADGRSIYVTGAQADSLVVLTRDGDGLSFEQRFQSGDNNGVFGLQGPTDVVISPDQRFVFVAATGSDAITVFERDTDSGLLTFVERVRDGFDTIVPDSNVINGVRRVLVSDDGRFLYALASGSRSIATFGIDEDSGRLDYLRVLRAGEPGAAGLDDAREIIASPGSKQLYLASYADNAVTTYERDPETGILTWTGSDDAGGGLLSPRDILLDDAGGRLYALSDDGQLHVFARNWSDGTLDYRETFGAADGVPLEPLALALAQPVSRLYVADGAAGRLQAFEELALSRCLVAAGNSDAVDIPVDLGRDAVGSLAYAATVHPAARGELVNRAELVPAAGVDPDPANSFGEDTTTVVAVSDLAIEKSGPSQAVAGESLSYQIRVTNAGPSDSLGMRVTDALPAPLLDARWACSPTPGSTCPADGTGSPDLAATLRVDGELVITVQAQVDPSFIGTIENAAQLTPEAGAADPTPGDHAASVVTDVRAEADVAVSKSTLTTPIVAGQPVRYRVGVVNNGPSDAPVVSVADTLPAALVDANWTCAASGAATCPAAGSGSAAFDANLPAGGAITLEFDATVIASATGTLTNRASASVQAPVTDPVPGNDAAAVDDDVVVRSDVGLSLLAPLNPFDPSSSIDLPLAVTVTNAGPSDAREIEVLLDLSAPVSQTRPGCTRPSPTQVRCLISQLEPGTRRTLDLGFDDLPRAPGSLVIDGRVSTRSEDSVPANDTASVDVALRTGADLSVAIDNGTTWVSPDEVFDYELRIDNFGSQDAVGAALDVAPDALLLDVAWTCTATGGAACSAPSGTGAVVEAVDLPSGGSLLFVISARVDPDVDLTVPVTLQTSASIVGAPPPDDINTLNDFDFDEDSVRLVMFDDGFEPAVVVANVAGTDGAPACVEMALKDGPASGRLLEARAADGRLVAWFDVARTGTGTWLRLTARETDGLHTSGWLPVQDRRAVVSAVFGPDGVRVSAPDGPLWHADTVLPAAGFAGRSRGVAEAASCKTDPQLQRGD